VAHSRNYSLAHQAEQYCAQDAIPRNLHLQSRILVHRRRRRLGPPCPCCGSKHAEIERTLDDIDVLIDTQKGTRVVKTLQNAATFDNWARQATTVPILLRCHEAQLELLLDETHKVVAAFGGNRSGKTSVAIYWIVRYWMKRGGKGARFWLCAHERDQAMTLLDKLLLGEYTEQYSPPALPEIRPGVPMLAKRWPTSPQSSDLSVDMVDGSKFYLKHAGKKGGNLKSKSIIAGILDEACEVIHRENWTILLARTVDSGGAIFAPTTPIAGHWMRDEVVDAVDCKHIKWKDLSMQDNPWISPDEVQRTIETIGDKATVDREIHGKWVGTGPRMWVDFDRTRHLHIAEWRTVEESQGEFLNLTPKLAPTVFRRHKKRITIMLGQDFNGWPMSTLVASIVCRPGVDQADRNNWILYILDEILTGTSRKPATVYSHFEFMVEKAHKFRGLPEGFFANLPAVVDGTGCSYSPEYQSRSMSHKRAMEECGYTVVPPMWHRKTGNPCNPNKLDQISLVRKLLNSDRLLINEQRCPRLIEGLEAQQRKDNGMPDKVSGAKSDRLSGPIDALEYLAWPFYSREIRPALKVA